MRMADGRKFPRYTYRKNIDVIIGDVKLPAYLLDISEEGLCFSSASQFNELDNLHIEISNTYEFGMNKAEVEVQVLNKNSGIGDTLYYCKLTAESWTFNSVLNHVKKWNEEQLEAKNLKSMVSINSLINR